jgi:ankyrin repeat protein
VDATSEAYGGGVTALELVATSTPTRRAGVQIPLIDLLLERGAAIDGVKPGASTVSAALANGCPEAAIALVERGARVDDVVVAAGVGRLDLVRHLAAASTTAQLERALVMAARYGALDVVEHLLDRGVDVGASDGMTALHEAAGSGRLDVMAMLIARGAPLETRNEFGGTVLGGVLWHAFNSDPADLARRDYPAVIDALVAAGARTDVYPEMERYINEVYRRAGRERGRA